MRRPLRHRWALWKEANPNGTEEGWLTWLNVQWRPLSQHILGTFSWNPKLSPKDLASDRGRQQAMSLAFLPTPLGRIANRRSTSSFSQSSLLSVKFVPSLHSLTWLERDQASDPKHHHPEELDLS